MRSALAFASVLVVACSGGSDGGTTTSGSSSGGTGQSGVTANCGDGNSSRIEGTLGGAAIDVTGATKNWSWVNIGNPSKFDGTFEGGALHLEWSGTVSNGSVTSATAASLTLTSNAAPRTFQSASFVYDSPNPESILKATITFDTGTVTVCMRKTD